MAFIKRCEGLAADSAAWDCLAPIRDARRATHPPPALRSIMDHLLNQVLVETLSNRCVRARGGDSGHALHAWLP